MSGYADSSSGQVCPAAASQPPVPTSAKNATSAICLNALHHPVFDDGWRSSLLPKLCRQGLLLLIICISLSLFGLAQVPSSQHVVLVIDENHSFAEVQANMPWLINQGNVNGFANNYHSDNGGSLMDYLWLASGSCESAANCSLPPNTNDFGCQGDFCAVLPITDDNIFRELNTANASWKVYAQSYDAAGGTVDTPDNGNGTSYYRRHNGATWYSDILNDVAGSQSKVVDLGQFAIDLANDALPRFVIIVPDGDHDAHDCPNGAAACLQAADDFLNQTLSPMLAKPYFQTGGDGMLIITFDECGEGTNDGCGAAVYTAVIGPKVKRNFVSNTFYQHENTLRTMLDALNIATHPGASETASPMADFFTTGGVGGGTGDHVDDGDWSCAGNCLAAATDTSIQLDGASKRFTYTGGAPFTDATWSTNPNGAFAGNSHFTISFTSQTDNPGAPQAFEIHVLRRVNGVLYPFQIQCDFQGSQLWRVYDPTIDDWVGTDVGCAPIDTANSWDDFAVHFNIAGSQLHYQDVVINGTSYPFNVANVNSVPDSGPDSMTVELKLIGDGTGTSYTWWIDNMALSFQP
jgi:hypothetical protein